MAFGPWAAYKPEAPPAPQIAGIRRTPRTLLRAAWHISRRFESPTHRGSARRVLEHRSLRPLFRGDPAATANSNSKTNFLSQTVTELARRYSQNPTIWMIEFLNEGNLDIDFDRAHHSRGEFVTLLVKLASVARHAGDRHLLNSGNGLPRPAAEHLDERKGWTPIRATSSSVHSTPRPPRHGRCVCARVSRGCVYTALGERGHFVRNAISRRTQS